MAAASSGLPRAAPGEATSLLGEAGGSLSAPYLLCITRRKTALIVTMGLIFLAIMSKESANVSIVVSLPAVERLNHTRVAAFLPGIHTASYSAGKLSQIFVTYVLGGRTTLTLAALFAGIGQLLVSTGSDTFMCLGTALTAYANAHVWGASARLASQWAGHNELGRAVGWTLNLANDLGFASFAAFFAALQLAFPAEEQPHLHVFSPFYFTAGLLLVNALVQSTLLRSSAVSAGFAPPQLLPEQQASKSEKGTVAAHPLDGVPLLPALRALLSHGRTWGVMCLFVCSVYSLQFASYLTTYATNGLGLADSDATLLITLYGVGAIVADLVVGPLKDSLTQSVLHVLHLTAALIGCVTMSFLLGLHCVGATSTLVAWMPALLPLLAFPISWIGVVYSVWAIRFAGPTHSSTIIGLVDVVGMACLIPYQFLLGRIVVHSSDFTLFWSLTACFYITVLLLGVVGLRIDDSLPPLARAEPSST